jgi:phosphatidylglycerophosphatase A
MAGIWASEAIVRHRRDEDPQLVCIDEVAGVLFALAAAPFTWAGVAVAVVAFRVFDMTKPWPASRLQHAPGGLGVVLDDVAAGGWAALVVVAGRLAGWL